MFQVRTERFPVRFRQTTGQKENPGKWDHLQKPFWGIGISTYFTTKQEQADRLDSAI